jgi:signal transduction histidine kinase
MIFDKTCGFHLLKPAQSHKLKNTFKLLERMPMKIIRDAAVSKRSALIFCLAIHAVLLSGGSRVLAGEKPADPVPVAATLTNILQVRHLAASRPEAVSCSVQLEGIVLWASPAKDQLILQDDSGGMVVNINLHKQPSVQPGEKLLIEGSCLASRGGIVSEALIDNDGIHSSFEKSMTLFLSAGLHPVSAEWFNGPANFEFEVAWMGPGMPRQRIPDTALFRTEANPAGGTNRLVPGLNYRCYEGEWEWLPDFSQLPVLKSGTIASFDLQVRTRDTNVGLGFTGFLKVPKAGVYTFWTTSDDGSKLSLDDLVLRSSVLGPATLPAPRPLYLGQFIPEEQEYQWSEVEGVVTSVSEAYGGVCVELTSGTGRAYLKFTDGSYDSLKLLLHSRIRVTGVCQTTFTVDGQTVPTLMVPDLKNIVIAELDPMFLADYPVLPIASLVETNFPETTRTIVHVGGIICSNPPENSLVIEDESGRILLETAQASPRPGERVEAVGWWSRAGSNVVLSGGFYEKISQPAKSDLTGLPLLTKAVQVINLSRTEARRGYPVRIRGVITALVGHDFFIQDSTWSVYAACSGSVAREILRVGDYWEIEGKSSVEFAPDIQVSRAVYLGPGNLPEPIHPTGDELVNGSLATKYVEIQGIATGVEANDLIMLTREGKIRLQLRRAELEDLKKYEGALIRVRGVGSPYRDTNQMILSPLRLLRLYNDSVSVDEPAPAHPFETPLKHVSDLLLFDVRADALRRIRIAGQVLNERQGEYFLMDGIQGFRFEPKSPVELHAGDLVEVVGYPDLNGPSPILREALVRLTGRAGLPAAQHLSEAAMLNGKLDATLVSIEAHLTGITINHAEQVLELQAGTRNFVARLANRRGTLPDISPGSLLALTGVYAGQGGDRTLSRDVDSFELLLNSPSDISVLAHPSWWTFRHTFAVIDGMVFVILLALVWIMLLRRQVEERSLQLTSEIKSREQAERQRALEAERARIAQDLHDDLGATLTEIRFLSAVKSHDALVPEATRSQLMEVSEKSRQMVSSLDEIVWAINPANDFLPSMVNYLCHVTEEFLRTTKIRCRLDVDESLPSVALTSEVRHNLYLVVREALTNVAKHSQAAEAWLRIHWKNDTLHIIVEDNGRGFAVPGVVSSGNGLSNMRRRLEKIGGGFECDTRPDSGTICRIHLPFK